MTSQIPLVISKEEDVKIENYLTSQCEHTQSRSTSLNINNNTQHKNTAPVPIYNQQRESSSSNCYSSSSSGGSNNDINKSNSFASKGYGDILHLSSGETLNTVDDDDQNHVPNIERLLNVESLDNEAHIVTVLTESIKTFWKTKEHLFCNPKYATDVYRFLYGFIYDSHQQLHEFVSLEILAQCDSCIVEYVRHRNRLLRSLNLVYDTSSIESLNYEYLKWDTQRILAGLSCLSNKDENVNFTVDHRVIQNALLELIIDGQRVLHFESSELNQILDLLCQLAAAKQQKPTTSLTSSTAAPDITSRSVMMKNLDSVLALSAHSLLTSSLQKYHFAAALIAACTSTHTRLRTLGRYIIVDIINKSDLSYNLSTTLLSSCTNIPSELGKVLRLWASELDALLQPHTSIASAPAALSLFNADGTLCKSVTSSSPCWGGGGQERHTSDAHVLSCRLNNYEMNRLRLISRGLDTLLSDCSPAQQSMEKLLLMEQVFRKILVNLCLFLKLIAFTTSFTQPVTKEGIMSCTSSLLLTLRNALSRLDYESSHLGHSESTLIDYFKSLLMLGTLSTLSSSIHILALQTLRESLFFLVNAAELHEDLGTHSSWRHTLKEILDLCSIQHKSEQIVQETTSTSQATVTLKKQLILLVLGLDALTTVPTTSPFLEPGHTPYPLMSTGSSTQQQQQSHSCSSSPGYQDTPLVLRHKLRYIPLLAKQLQSPASCSAESKNRELSMQDTYTTTSSMEKYIFISFEKIFDWSVADIKFQLMYVYQNPNLIINYCTEGIIIPSYSPRSSCIIGLFPLYLERYHAHPQYSNSVSCQALRYFVDITTLPPLLRCFINFSIFLKKQQHITENENQILSQNTMPSVENDNTSRSIITQNQENLTTDPPHGLHMAASCDNNRNDDAIATMHACLVRFQQSIDKLMSCGAFIIYNLTERLQKLVTTLDLNIQDHQTEKRNPSHTQNLTSGLNCEKGGDPTKYLDLPVVSYDLSNLTAPPIADFLTSPLLLESNEYHYSNNHPLNSSLNSQLLDRLKDYLHKKQNFSLFLQHPLIIVIMRFVCVLLSGQPLPKLLYRHLEFLVSLLFPLESITSDLQQSTLLLMRDGVNLNELSSTTTPTTEMTCMVILTLNTKAKDFTMISAASIPEEDVFFMHLRESLTTSVTYKQRTTSSSTLQVRAVLESVDIATEVLMEKWTLQESTLSSTALTPSPQLDPYLEFIIFSRNPFVLWHRWMDLITRVSPGVESLTRTIILASLEAQGVIEDSALTTANSDILADTLTNIWKTIALLLAPKPPPKKLLLQFFTRQKNKQANNEHMNVNADDDDRHHHSNNIMDNTDLTHQCCHINNLFLLFFQFLAAWMGLAYRSLEFVCRQQQQQQQKGNNTAMTTTSSKQLGYNAVIHVHVTAFVKHSAWTSNLVRWCKSIQHVILMTKKKQYEKSQQVLPSSGFSSELVASWWNESEFSEPIQSLSASVARGMTIVYKKFQQYSEKGPPELPFLARGAVVCSLNEDQAYDSDDENDKTVEEEVIDEASNDNNDTENRHITSGDGTTRPPSRLVENEKEFNESRPNVLSVTSLETSNISPKPTTIVGEIITGEQSTAKHDKIMDSTISPNNFITPPSTSTLEDITATSTFPKTSTKLTGSLFSRNDEGFIKRNRMHNSTLDFLHGLRRTSKPSTGFMSLHQKTNVSRSRIPLSLAKKIGEPLLPQIKLKLPPKLPSLSERLKARNNNNTNVIISGGSGNGENLLTSNVKGKPRQTTNSVTSTASSTVSNTTKSSTILAPPPPIKRIGQDARVMHINDKDSTLADLTCTSGVTVDKAKAVAEAKQGCEEILTEILKWDIFNLNEVQIPGLEDLSERLPLTFDDEKSFRRVFYPLVLEECRCSLTQGGAEKKLEGSPIQVSGTTRMSNNLIAVVSSALRADGTEITSNRDDASSCVGANNKSSSSTLPLQFQTWDLLMLVPRDTPKIEDGVRGRTLAEMNDPPSAGYLMAIAEKEVKPPGKGAGKQVFWEIRMPSQHCPRLVKQLRRIPAHRVAINSIWTAYLVGSLTTSVREFQSLYMSSFCSLFRLILNPKVIRNNVRSYQTGGMNSELPKHQLTSLVPSIQSSCTLNDSQLAALLHALTEERGIALLQGPPGTGKTKTLLAILATILHFNTKNPMKKSCILVCAPSNAAVDEIAARVLNEGLPHIDGSAGKLYPTCVRVGNPSRITRPEVLEISLTDKVKKEGKELESARKNEYFAKKDELEKKIEGVEKEIGQVHTMREVQRFAQEFDNDSSSGSSTAGDSSVSSTRCLSELFRKKRLLHEQRIRMRDQLSKDVASAGSSCRETTLSSCDIVFATLSGSATEHLTGVSFSYVIIDEAAQAVELSTLIPLRWEPRRVILIGDPQQLPATVLSHVARQYAYERSLFERLQRCGIDVKMLSLQYRMRTEISAFPAAHFYRQRLLNAPSVISRPRLPCHVWTNLFRPFLFFDVPSEENRHAVSQSLSNRQEATFIVSLLRLFITHFMKKQKNESETKDDNGSNTKTLSSIAVESIAPPIKMHDIAIVTPYKQQVTEIRQRLDQFPDYFPHNSPEVCTIDSFQGREKRIIIFTCVRSDPTVQQTFTSATDWDNDNSSISSEDDEQQPSDSVTSPKLPRSTTRDSIAEQRAALGFVADIRRMNVAITRARDCLWVVGNAATLTKNPSWKAMINFAKGKTFKNLPLSAQQSSVMSMRLSKSHLAPHSLTKEQGIQKTFINLRLEAHKLQLSLRPPQFHRPLLQSASASSVVSAFLELSEEFYLKHQEQQPQSRQSSDNFARQRTLSSCSSITSCSSGEEKTAHSPKLQRKVNKESTAAKGSSVAHARKQQAPRAASKKPIRKIVLNSTPTTTNISTTTSHSMTPSIKAFEAANTTPSNEMPLSSINYLNPISSIHQSYPESTLLKPSFSATEPVKGFAMSDNSQRTLTSSEKLKRQRELTSSRIVSLDDKNSTSVKRPCTSIIPIIHQNVPVSNAMMRTSNDLPHFASSSSTAMNTQATVATTTANPNSNRRITWNPPPPPPPPHHVTIFPHHAGRASGVNISQHNSEFPNIRPSATVSYVRDDTHGTTLTTTTLPPPPPPPPSSYSSTSYGQPPTMLHVSQKHYGSVTSSYHPALVSTVLSPPSTHPPDGWPTPQQSTVRPRTQDAPYSQEKTYSKF